MERKIIAVTGKDAERFLHDLVTNDVEGLEPGRLLYAALLTPQGKFLFDFFLFRQEGGFLLDVAADAAPALVQRLLIYRLRADLRLEETALSSWPSDMPEAALAFADPRDPAMGLRNYGPGGSARYGDPAWQERRIRLGLPEGGRELLANESYILEAGFERLNGVSFRKGCYVGQEVTARMKHKTELKNGLVRLKAEAPLTPGAAVLSGAAEIGRITSASGGLALARLRLDRIGPELTASGLRLTAEPA